MILSGNGPRRPRLDGNGEPAISLAQAVGPRGRVIATDLLREMLLGAQGQATHLGRRNLRQEQHGIDKA